MHIKIEWMEDAHDCEICGPSYASGAIVRLGDTNVMFTPAASCLGGESWTPEEIFRFILEHLGYTIEETSK